MLRTLLFIPIACLFFCSTSLAATFTVTNTDDSGPGSFRQALTDANAAAGSDTIEFAIPNANPGGSTIDLSSALPNITGDLTINGPGMDLLTLNRNSATSFTILSTGGNIVINGLTVQNGLAPSSQQPGVPWSTAYGGGITNGGNLTINDCRITGNHVLSDVAYGGGISNGGQLTVNRTIISGNEARSRFIGTQRQGEYGSAIYGGFFSSATLNDVTITGNGHGSAAIYNDPATMIIRRSNIYGNATGGVYNNIANVSVFDSSIYQNAGGGIGSLGSSSGTLSITNSTIAENTGTGVTAGVSQQLNLYSCTIVSNDGGGVWAISNSVFQNNIIAANNTAAGNNDVSAGNGLSASFNLVGVGSGTSIHNGVNGNIVGTAAAPIDPLLMPFNYYGGDMPVFIPMSMSPAVNAGSPVLYSDHDERGVVRPVGLRQDMGAVEFNLTPNRNLPLAAVGTAYDQTFQAFGLTGYSNFQFSISAGSLPPGMTIQNLGSNIAKIAGMPTVEGTFTFTILATDPIEYTVSADYSIVVSRAGSISFVPIQGRVTRPDGRPVRNAFVQAIDSNGHVVAESPTNPFGYFHFASLQIFAPYTFAVRHKTLTAAAPTVLITTNMADIGIVTQ